VMCDIDDGERCSVWRETQRRARISHRCDACAGAIGVGEIYLVHFSVFEGYTTSEKMCVECEVDRKEFADAHNGMLYTPGSMSEVLGNCISEGDEDSETKWRPMLAAMATRKAIGKASGATS
jgi:hypothetical protein